MYIQYIFIHIHIIISYCVCVCFKSAKWIEMDQLTNYRTSALVLVSPGKCYSLSSGSSWGRTGPGTSL